MDRSKDSSPTSNSRHWRRRALSTPHTLLETEGGHKGLAGQIPGLFAAPPQQPVAQPQSSTVNQSSKVSPTNKKVQWIVAGSVTAVLILGMAVMAWKEHIDLENTKHRLQYEALEMERRHESERRVQDAKDEAERAKVRAEAARTLERECFAALLTDGAQLFTNDHGNLLTGSTSAFGFEALDKAMRLFWEQKGMDGELIMVRPSFLLIPTAQKTTVMRLLSMGTTDGTPLGPRTLYQDYPVIDTPYLGTNNGLYVNEGSKKKMVPGNDKAWYLFASPTDIPVIVGTFLNGKTSPTIQRANMRFSLDGRGDSLAPECIGGVYAKDVCGFRQVHYVMHRKASPFRA